MGVYLGDFAEIGVHESGDANQSEGLPSSTQEALREQCAEWGVARSVKKALCQAPVALCRGAEVRGVHGRASLSYAKMFRLVGLTWYLISLLFHPW